MNFRFFLPVACAWNLPVMSLGPWNKLKLLSRAKVPFVLAFITILKQASYLIPWASKGGCLGSGGKSPVGAYKMVEALQFFSGFQNNSNCIIKKGWNVDLVDISSVWQFIWQQLTTILLVYHLSILQYFQFNEVSQGWRCLRIRMPTGTM